MIFLKLLAVFAVGLVALAAWCLVGAIIIGIYNWLAKGTAWGQIDSPDDDGFYFCLLGWPLWIGFGVPVWVIWAIAQFRPGEHYSQVANLVTSGISAGVDRLFRRCPHTQE